MNINTGINPAQSKVVKKALKTLMKSDMGLALLSSLVLPLLAQQGQEVSLPSSPGFGNSGNAGTPSIGNFLGGGGGGASAPAGRSSAPATSSAGGPSVNPSELQGGSELGKKIAADAQNTATGSGGYCFKYVSETLRKFGINTSGASAYMAADQLANNPKVKEVNVSPQDFKKLPPGAIVVWDKGAGHPHGHISVALGNGKEASDVIRDQITNYGTKPRVFIPK